MVDLFIPWRRFFASLSGSRARLWVEILALRRKINILRRKAPRRMHFTNTDRLIFRFAPSADPDDRGRPSDHQALDSDSFASPRLRGVRAAQVAATRGRPKIAVEIRQLVRQMIREESTIPFIGNDRRRTPRRYAALTSRRRQLLRIARINACRKSAKGCRALQCPTARCDAMAEKDRLWRSSFTEPSQAVRIYAGRPAKLSASLKGAAIDG